MPRLARRAYPGYVYHVLNRGNRRQRVFFNRDDYATFSALLADTVAALGMRVCAYCLMPNHWHLVVWPSEAGQLSAFMFQLTNAHVARHRTVHGTTGTGHLYQGRFKSFPIQHDEHYLRVVRYVEANPCRAGLAHRAGAWLWSSVADRAADVGAILHTGPVPLPADWPTVLETSLPPGELTRIRECTCRGTPYGSPDWTIDTAALHRSTLRRRGRPLRASV